MFPKVLVGWAHAKQPTPLGAALTAQRGRDPDGHTSPRPDGTLLAPIHELATALDTSVRTLKRVYKKGGLPVVIVGTQWKVPADFAAAVISSIRPGRAANVAEIGREWFARRDEADAGVAA